MALVTKKVAPLHDHDTDHLEVVNDGGRRSVGVNIDDATFYAVAKTLKG